MSFCAGSEAVSIIILMHETTQRIYSWRFWSIVGSNYHCFWERKKPISTAEKFLSFPSSNLFDMQFKVIASILLLFVAQAMAQDPPPRCTLAYLVFHHGKNLSYFFFG